MMMWRALDPRRLASLLARLTARRTTKGTADPKDVPVRPASTKSAAAAPLVR